MSHRIPAAAALFALATSTQALTLTAGSQDGFDSTPDAASPSAALVASFATAGGEFAGGVQDFDLTGGINGGAPDRQVAHTFSGWSTGLAGASLTLRVQGGSDAFVATDGLALSFVTNGAASYPSQVVYARAFGSGSGGGSVLFSASDPGLLTDFAWATGSDVEFTLDLAALPLVGGGTLNLLGLMGANGFLDVNVSDDTAVDFMILEVTPVPLPPAVLPLLSGLAVLGLRRIRPRG
ncbi:MAG: hypothetical protein AB7O21_15995 [Gammaproteobacteria bacterium]